MLNLKTPNAKKCLAAGAVIALVIAAVFEEQFDNIVRKIRGMIK